MSIANNLDEAQKKVKELQDQLKDLTLEPSAIIDIGNLTKANNAINTLTKAVTAAKKEASDLEDGFGGVFNNVVKIVGEMKKGNSAADLATKSFKSIQDITQKLKYDQQDISKLNLDQLKSLQKKLKTNQQEIKDQAQSIIQRENLNSGTDAQIKASIEMKLALGKITEEEAAIVRGAREGFSVFKETNELLNDEFTSPPPNVSLAYYYQKNVLAGIWAETYSRLLDQNKTFPQNSVFKGPQGSKIAIVTFPGLKTSDTDLPVPPNAASGSQVYITLESAFDIINKYIVPDSSGDNDSLITLSVKSSDITNPTGSDLYCIAHPTQLSVNPTVCLINSPLWSDKGQVATAISGATATPVTAQIQSIVNDIQSVRNSNFSNAGDLDKFATAVSKITDLQTFSAVEQALQTTFENIITNEIKLRFNILKYISPLPIRITALQRAIDSLTSIPGLNINVSPSTRTSGYQGGSTTYIELTSITITGSPNASAANLVAVSINGQSKQAIATLSLLQILKPFFYNNDPYSEIGTIKNIYVNVEFLYKKALDGFTESQDTNQKNEINLYNYVKGIVSAIQQSIGNVNNFEIHVDPVDNNVARVIDVNYTQPDKAKKDTLFKLQVHNLKSIVRNYSLQSQIFPNQSSLIAIGSQAKGGQLGMQNNTMIDFNRTLVDRIIPEKTFGGESSLTINTNKETPLAANLAGIIQLYAALSVPPSNSPAADPNSPTPSTTTSTNFETLYTTAKNNLKDLIVYFQSIPDLESSSANRNIIPIQFSFEMDGIGGLVIGHLFTINQDILPIGYKGPNLAQTVTRIGHTISNNDWVTKIDALNIILNNKAGKVKFQELDLVKIINTSLNAAFANNQPTSNVGGTAPIGISSYLGYIEQNAPRTPVIANEYSPALQTTFPQFSKGIKLLLEAQTQLEGFYPGSVSYRTNNPGNVQTDTSKGKITSFPTLEEGIKAQWNRVLKGALNNTSRFYTSNMTLFQYLSVYAPPPQNNPTNYTNFVINFFKTNANIIITANTTLEQINAIN